MKIGNFAKGLVAICLLVASLFCLAEYPGAAGSLFLLSIFVFWAMELSNRLDYIEQHLEALQERVGQLVDQ